MKDEILRFAGYGATLVAGAALGATAVAFTDITAHPGGLATLLGSTLGAMMIVGGTLLVQLLENARRQQKIARSVEEKINQAEIGLEAIILRHETDDEMDVLHELKRGDHGWPGQLLNNIENTLTDVRSDVVDIGDVHEACDAALKNVRAARNRLSDILVGPEYRLERLRAAQHDIHTTQQAVRKYRSG